MQYSTWAVDRDIVSPLPEDGLKLVTAVFHHLAPHATIVGIEHIEELVEQSRKNLRADGVKLGDEAGGVQIIQGDGREGRYTTNSSECG